MLGGSIPGHRASCCGGGRGGGNGGQASLHAGAVANPTSPTIANAGPRMAVRPPQKVPDGYVVSSPRPVPSDSYPDLRDQRLYFTPSP